jgi:hypothetical protein
MILRVLARIPRSSDLGNAGEDHGDRRAANVTVVALQICGGLFTIEIGLPEPRGIRHRSTATTDPPFRHSLPVTLAFAATADPPAAVLTGRTATAATTPGVIRRLRPADTGDMVQVSIVGRPLTATAALVWNGDLPRPLQQILFDTADGATPPPSPWDVCLALADHEPAAG